MSPGFMVLLLELPAFAFSNGEGSALAELERVDETIMPGGVLLRRDSGGAANPVSYKDRWMEEGVMHG